MDGVRRRFRQTLRRYLCRCDILSLLAFEQDDDDRLHVHGTIVVHCEAEVELVRSALKVAGGKWASSSGRAYQVKIRHNPDHGWSSYFGKNQGLPSACRAPGSEQACWMMSHALGRLAKRLHQEARDQKGKFAAKATRPPKPKKALCHRGLLCARPTPLRKDFSSILSLALAKPNPIQILTTQIAPKPPLLHRLE
jgi:hypothetical protein